MTDEQFDEICRGALAFDPGPAKSSTWSRIQPRKWTWLPTIPEILGCGCAAALALLIVALRFTPNSDVPPNPNPVVQQAMAQSETTWQASTLDLPDPSQWTSTSLSLSSEFGTFERGRP
jgi:hypothetical protein